MYALSSSPESHGWMFWTKILFLMELMVEQVSSRIQFGLILLVVGASFVVWVMMRSSCSDCVPVQAAKSYPLVATSGTLKVICININIM